MKEKTKQKLKIDTTFGDIIIEVYTEKAPITVANFLRYVDEGLYDNTTFFRTVTMDNQPNSPVKIEVIQGGMVEKEKSYPPIKHETTDNIGFKHVDGAVSMARGKPGTATSSFFICIGDQPELDYGGKRNPDGEGFAAFGRVLDGMNVVKKIQLQPSEKQRLTPPVQIVTISRI